MEEAEMPFPKPLKTPPVTMRNFIVLRGPCNWPPPDKRLPRVEVVTSVGISEGRRRDREQLLEVGFPAVGPVWPGSVRIPEGVPYPRGLTGASWAPKAG